MVGTWREQWDRVGRWYSKFSETNSGRIHDRESDYYQDEAYAFFQNCHHLKDWLKNDPETAPLATGIEELITDSRDLKLCADLCNGSKHLKLTAYRVSPDTKIEGRHASLVLHSTVGVGASSKTAGPGDPTISVKFEVQAGGHNYDAFAIAEECMKAWETYLKREGFL